jgi:hypothetical protein
MNILFDEIKKMRDEIRQLKEETNGTRGVKITGNQNMNTYENSPHNNTTLNIQLNGYDSDRHIDFLSTVLQKVLPEILELPVREDIPRVIQVHDRIKQIVSSCFRNPDYKEMQNVYVLNEELKGNNAFIYQDNTWKIKDWSKLGTEIIQKIRMHASRIKTKSDILKIMKHIVVLAGADVPMLEKMSERQVQQLYKHIGKELNFDTIVV